MVLPAWSYKSSFQHLGTSSFSSTETWQGAYEGEQLARDRSIEHFTKLRRSLFLPVCRPRTELYCLQQLRHWGCKSQFTAAPVKPKTNRVVWQMQHQAHTLLPDNVRRDRTHLSSLKRCLNCHNNLPNFPFYVSFFTIRPLRLINSNE